MRTCPNLVISLLLQKSLRDAVLPGDREGETEKFQKVRKTNRRAYSQMFRVLKQPCLCAEPS